MPIKPTPNSNQAKLDRLNTMAQRGPLSQTNQRNLSHLQNKMGVTPQAVPMVSPQPYNIQTLSKLNPTFGDTSVKNLNTIGAPAPAGPGPGLMGGGNPPPTTSFQPGMGGNIGGSAAGTPAGMNMRTMKKGGKVKKMASGGMTSKVSSASKRADGIATRGKTKCKMY